MANSVTYSQIGGNTIVQADLDGSIATAEVRVELTGAKVLTSGDFPL